MYSESGNGEYSSFRSDGREPGARRKKLAGYLKAANELRQSYFSAEPGSHDPHSAEDGPGAFPDAAVVRSGNEEMVLFPSYARRHRKTTPRAVATPGQEISEEEYWRREWSKHEDSNAVVDVDVRGWIYTPHRGPNTRKQRIMIGLARQLSGIPAPPTAGAASDQSGVTASRSSSPTRHSQQEEDLIAFEAENIVRKGQQEERYANRGAFSEKPAEASETDSIYETSGSHRPSYASTVSSYDDGSNSIMPVQKRSSWSQPSKMNSAELAIANKHLLTRLRPFMANPLASAAISAFFYNDQASRQQTVYTDPSGHFTFRAALDFVPTHVRVLAAEKLSITEEVIVTSPKGVSMISDIDDTVKHSAISAGAREIFRNAFIRELSDLTIEGVREWYTTLHDMGVKIHYVSNSPWQMYPVLTSYFKMARLPRGSFHLKQYSGMLQGIFEPVAERKKSSLDKLLRDFPDRKFILVGDSGEADLEVYTDTASDNPGRILGIFIRDVTTPVRSGYFDSNLTPPGGSGHSSPNHIRRKSGDSLAMSKRLSRPHDIREDDADMKAAIAASLLDMEEETRAARRSINPDAPRQDRLSSFNSSQEAPVLPPRRREKTMKPVPPEEDLIDLRERPPANARLAPPSRNLSFTGTEGANPKIQKPSPSPPPPPKPAQLRSPSPNSAVSTEGAMRMPPPRPRKPSSAINPLTPLPSSLQTAPTASAARPSPLSQVTRQASAAKQPPPLPARRTYREFAKETITRALPTATSPYWQSEATGGGARSRPASSRGSSQPSSPLSLRPMTSAKSFEDFNLPDSALPSSRPPIPARRNISAYSTQTRKANRQSGAWDEDGTSSPGEGMSKKEYMWKQRWARAKDLLERNGVTLRSWRVGADVADVCVRLVEMELRDIAKHEGGTGRKVDE